MTQVVSEGAGQSLGDRPTPRLKFDVVETRGLGKINFMVLDSQLGKGGRGGGRTAGHAPL
jgi:hypothetical protein